MDARGAGIGRCLAHGLVMTTLTAGLVAGTLLSAWAAVVPGRPHGGASSPASDQVERAPSVETRITEPAAALSNADAPVSSPRAVFEPEVERWRELGAAATISAQRATGVALDEDLLLALVAVESGGLPTARSAAGAVGLTQVEPATYADLQARYGALLANRSLAQPSTNLLAGALYLADCARMLHLEVSNPATLELVLDAYNLGPRATAEWWHGGSREPPPRETIQHSTRIMAAYLTARE
jgi:soluble lytic murein transglycosylase-like protein